MQNLNLFISLAGKGKVMCEWEGAKTINTQRLYYIKGGTGNYTDHAGRQVAFLPGHFYLFAYNCSQDFFSDPACPLDHLYIDFISVPLLLSRAPLCYQAEEGSPLRQMADLLDALLPIHPKTKAEKLPRGLTEGLTTVLLHLFDRLSPLSFSSDRTVNEALAFLHTHYGEDCKIDLLAAKLGYQTDHFIRRFHAVVGQTPYAYLRRYRLYKASLLLSGGASLAQAAARVGYESASSLSRALRSAEQRHES